MTVTGSSRSLGKRKQKLPSYLHHKATGQARVIIEGHTHYLGEYGTEESRRRYGELIAEHSSGVPVDPFVKSAAQGGAGLTVNELCLVFLRHAKKHYTKNGKPTAELACFKSAIKILVELYGSISIDELGPLKLKAVRQGMIDKEWTRPFINKSISRIRHVFRYGVESELVEPAILQRLEAVSPLLAGRTEAVDNAPRRPVPQVTIDKVRAIVPERTRDLIDLQLLTGARPGELLGLTGGMIDRTNEIWIAKLDDHKMAHKGKERILVFGPKAQLILRKYVALDGSRRLFTVRRDTYGKAIAAACEKLKLPHWTPHWLRHNAASRLREEYGLDVAQVMLGHSTADMTELYAHLNLKKAVKAAKEAG